LPGNSVFARDVYDQSVFDFENSQLFSEREKAALRVAAHAGMAPNAVEPQHMAALAESFSEKEAFQVFAVTSLLGFLNRRNDTMATTLESSPKSFASEKLAGQGWAAGKHD